MLADATGDAEGIRFDLTLQFLASWQQGMGSAWLLCLGRCVCDSDIHLRGHRTSHELNASISVERTISMCYLPPPLPSETHDECAVAIRIDGKVATGTKPLQLFRIRDVVLSTMKPPCHQAHPFGGFDGRGSVTAQAYARP
jgi:hypothetical protein